MAIIEPVDISHGGEELEELAAQERQSVEDGASISVSCYKKEEHAGVVSKTAFEVPLVLDLLVSLRYPRIS